MISDYTQKFTKNDIHIFQKNSIFLIHIHEDTAYFDVEFLHNEGIEKLPINFKEIANQLEKLGVVGEIRFSNQLEDGYFAIENYDPKKVDLFFNILFNQENRKNPKQLDEVTYKYIQKGYRSNTLMLEIGINDDLINFNDIEILVHAISIEYPKKIITSISEKNIKESLEYIIIKKHGIYDHNYNIIFSLNNEESIIINELKSKGMNLVGLMQLTNQPTSNAVSSSIKVIQGNIKKYNLEKLISLKFSRSEKIYYLNFLK